MVSIGVLVPTGPQNRVRCSGSVTHRKTSSRGAWKTRVIRSSEVCVIVRSCLLEGR